MNWLDGVCLFVVIVILGALSGAASAGLEISGAVKYPVSDRVCIGLALLAAGLVCWRFIAGASQ